MGCATSKLDDSPAVALCRDRCAFLDEAVRHRFAFAEAHAAYLLSLKAVGLSLDRFFYQDLGGGGGGPSPLRPSSPLLNLPPRRKGDPHSPGSPPEKNQHHLRSRSGSGSGSHIHFDSGSDDERGSGSEAPNHRDVSSPARQQLPYAAYAPDYANFNFSLPEAGGGGGGGFLNIHYMKNQTSPSVVLTHQPMSAETVRIGESTAPSSSYYSNLNYANGDSQNLNGYSNYGGGGGGGFFGDSSVPPPPVAASTSKSPAPAPPSPPRSSTWDFLNPFETVEKFYPVYSSSHDSREVREEEGIPDLEEDDDDDEVVKAVHGDQKHVDSGGSSYSKAVLPQERARVAFDLDSKQNMNKKSVESSKNVGNANEFKPRGEFKDDLEVLKEIQVQFDRASQSGDDLSKFLEVGKLPYKQKQASNQVSSKILHLTAVSFQPSTFKNSDNADPAFLDILQDVELKSKSLSSTLHKLYLWEKKLYEEVKIEEKMRVDHEKKSNKLKRMDVRGSEAHKVDATRSLVKSLSTKMKIAIQVVDKISMKISRLRDEELWPQLYEFINGLTRMWKSMLECHNNQCQAIGEAKRLDTIAFQKHFSDAQAEATRQLQHDLINWTLWFSHWVSALKGYVRSLNNWLMKCLLYVPEETSDGIAPFSPSRMGAPTVFVVCNHWSQALERVSEKEVVDSMREFASNVLQLWDRDKAEMREKMLADKDERRLKSLEKEDLKIQKEIQFLEKKMVVIPGGENDSARVVYQSETSKRGGLQASLQHVLEAMGKFSGDSLRIHEELLQRIEEDKKQVPQPRLDEHRSKNEG